VAGGLPFGLLYGARAREQGLSLVQTVGLSLAVFTGSTQMVFLSLWQQWISWVALILACLVINLRLAMYGADLAPPPG